MPPGGSGGRRRATVKRSRPARRRPARATTRTRRGRSGTAAIGSSADGRGARGGPAHLVAFSSPESLRPWAALHDTVMGGESSGKLEWDAARGCASFPRHLSGVGGFASVRDESGWRDLSAFAAIDVTTRLPSGARPDGPVQLCLKCELGPSAPTFQHEFWPARAVGGRKARARPVRRSFRGGRSAAARSTARASAASGSWSLGSTRAASRTPASRRAVSSPNRADRRGDIARCQAPETGRHTRRRAAHYSARSNAPSGRGSRARTTR